MDERTGNKTPQRIAINGMGRIGRTLFRLLVQKNELQNLIAMNDIMPKENLIYLLKYDSIRGPLNFAINSTDRGIEINGHEIAYSEQPEIENLPWRSHGIQTVVEATGLFTLQEEASKHLAHGVEKVLLTTFSKNVPTTVWGVNHLLNSNGAVIAPGDCTINCVAPIIKTIQSVWSIQSIHINVIQGYTTRQELIDRPYKGLRRGRAAADSIIPFEVNITPALETIFPSLKNKIQSMSTRVPVSCGAFAELSMVLNAEISEEQINSLFEGVFKKELKNITSITHDPIVSSDILNNSHSGVIDGLLTRVTNGNHVRALAWFDNEWGYSNRLFNWLMK
jgi:glyceraldehyde 3-phosphate dehydrogenase